MSEEKTKREPRALIGKDLYLLTAIIGKIGIRNVMCCWDTLEVREAAKENEGAPEEVLKEKIGTLIFYGVVDVILEKLEKCEDSVNKLLARLYDMKEKEIQELEANEYLDMLIDVMQSDRFADFFGRACESLKRVM